jgi:hypothetical protein
LTGAGKLVSASVRVNAACDVYFFFEIDRNCFFWYDMAFDFSELDELR